MAIKPDIHQTVIIPPAISMDNAVWVDLAANNGLQRGFQFIRGDLAIDAVTANEQTKDNRFAGCSTSKHVRNFFLVQNSTHRLQFRSQRATELHRPGPYGHEYAGKCCWCCEQKAQSVRYINSRQIHSKQTDNLSKLGFADFEIVAIPVSPNHFKKLACVEYIFIS